MKNPASVASALVPYNESESESLIVLVNRLVSAIETRIKGK